MGLFDRFRKDSVKDPFGGDDDGDFYEDEESSFSGSGPKIALAASGAVFAAVVGFIGYVLFTAPESTDAAPLTGNLADLEIVEDSEPTVADATAATDRSAERRPWLTAQTPPAASDRLGLDAKTKPAVPAAKPAAPAPPAAAKPAVAPPSATAAVTPQPPAKPAAQTPTAKETQVAVLPTPKVSPTGLKPTAPAPAAPAPAAPAAAAKTAPIPPAAPAPATPAATAKTAPTPPVAPEAAKTEPAIDGPAEEMPSVIAGIPALNAPGVAPGAPERFTATGDAGPAVAGGRPRLVDPPLPPTDRVAIAAPPPRFAALRDVRKETAPPPTSGAKIAIVVRGLGLSQSATDAAITKLPAAVTLAFSPYARNLKGWVERAKAAGHEVLVEVPLESKDFPAQDPGPLGLLTTLELKDNAERLDAIIKASSGAIGVFDAMGTKFRESDPHISPMFAKLKEQNLFYVQGSPGIRVGEATVPTATADVVLDERPFRAAIDARLDYAERLARYQGSTIAALSAKPVSFERLVLWLDQATKRGIVLAPISAALIRSDSPATAPAPPAAKAKPGAQDAGGAKAKPEAPAAAKAKAKT